MTPRKSTLMLIACGLLAASSVRASLLARPAARVESGIFVPAEWAGVWSLQISIYDCDTSTLLFSTTNQDTICAGDVLTDPGTDPDLVVTCDGSATGTTFTLHCDGTGTPLPGCSVSYTYDMTTERTGDTYTSTGTQNFAYTGDCGGMPDSCMRTEITGTRISDAAGLCTSTPATTRSWGALKSSYR